MALAAFRRPIRRRNRLIKIAREQRRLHYSSINVHHRPTLSSVGVISFVHRRRLHRGTGKFVTIYTQRTTGKRYFAQATILTLLSYTKMVKIGAIRSVLATKTLPKCSAETASPKHHSPLFIDSLLKACPHCRRKVRQYKGDSRRIRRLSTLAVFCDSRTFLRQCG